MTAVSTVYQLQRGPRVVHTTWCAQCAQRAPTNDYQRTTVRNTTTISDRRRRPILSIPLLAGVFSQTSHMALSARFDCSNRQTAWTYLYCLTIDQRGSRTTKMNKAGRCKSRQQSVVVIRSSNRQRRQWSVDWWRFHAREGFHQFEVSKQHMPLAILAQNSESIPDWHDRLLLSDRSVNNAPLVLQTKRHKLNAKNTKKLFSRKKPHTSLWALIHTIQSKFLQWLLSQ